MTATVILSVLSISSLAVNTQAGPDPNALTLGSDKVVFIKDAPRDENYQVTGEISGDGTGSDAENPLKPSDHAADNGGSNIGVIIGIIAAVAVIAAAVIIIVTKKKK